MAPSPELQTGTLRDGTEVRLREQTDGDRAVLAQFFEHLSAQSRYLRFMAGVPPELPRSALDVLDAADGDTHVGLIAVHRGRAIGTARYIRTQVGSSEADVALTVADEFQGQGLGRLLLAELTNRAAASGIDRLRFEMLSENRGMRALAKAMGASLRSDGPITSALIAVGPGSKSGRTHGTSPARVNLAL